MPSVEKYEAVLGFQSPNVCEGVIVPNTIWPCTQALLLLILILSDIPCNTSWGSLRPLNVPKSVEKYQSVLRVRGGGYVQTDSLSLQTLPTGPTFLRLTRSILHRSEISFNRSKHL